ncbi:MAG TPA: hypothetical protein VL284_11100 [Thermoanaerobaculia bacterium]|nr:hypothetical protein [Thermoanaerobaculia bacterium]
MKPAEPIVRFGFPWWLRPFLMSGVAGITLGRRIYAIDRATLRHELVHFRQIQRLGTLNFYGTWIREYVSNRRRGMSSDEAYRRISLEMEAFEGERSL